MSRNKCNFPIYKTRFYPEVSLANSCGTIRETDIAQKETMPCTDTCNDTFPEQKKI